MPEAPQPAKRPGSRPWLITAVLCGLLLVGSIVTGLWSALSLHGKTIDLLDAGARDESFARMADDSARLTRLSLFAGTPVALLYLTSLYMYRRSRKL